MSVAKDTCDLPAIARPMPDVCEPKDTAVVAPVHLVAELMLANLDRAIARNWVDLECPRLVVCAVG